MFEFDNILCKKNESSNVTSKILNCIVGMWKPKEMGLDYSIVAEPFTFLIWDLVLSWFLNKTSKKKKGRKKEKKMSEGNALISFDVLQSQNEKQTSQNLEGFTWFVKTPRFSFNICDTVRQSWSCQISMKVRNILTHLTLMTTIRQLDSVRFTFRYDLDIAPISFSN